MTGLTRLLIVLLVLSASGCALSSRYSSLDNIFPDERVRELIVAADRGDAARVRRLAGQGVDLNYQGKLGFTPLWWMHRMGDNIEGFTMLLEMGADPNLPPLVMHNPVLFNDLEFLRQALKHGGDPNIVRSDYGESPIFTAVSFGHRRAMHMLIEAGADIDFRSLENYGDFTAGDTPVVSAAASDNYHIVLELLELGADYSVKNDIGQDLMFWIDRHRSRIGSGPKQSEYLEQVIDWLVERQAESGGN